MPCPCPVILKNCHVTCPYSVCVPCLRSCFLDCHLITHHLRDGNISLQSVSSVNKLVDKLSIFASNTSSWSYWQTQDVFIITTLSLRGMLIFILIFRDIIFILILRIVSLSLSLSYRYLQEYHLYLDISLDIFIIFMRCPSNIKYFHLLR